MLIALVTNSGAGLQVDAELLTDFLSSLGHSTETIQYDQPYAGSARFDLSIFLEVVNEALFGLARRNFYFANPKWLKASDIPIIRRHSAHVFAKTRQATLDLAPLFPSVHHVGFLTRDRMDAAVPRELRALHVGGKSGYRNTPAVISAWREYRYWLGPSAPSIPLTVVSRSSTVQFDPTPDVTFIRHATDDELRRLQNSHLFHVMPSAYEGWGHALHESLGVGAILLTTDAPPMNESPTPFKVPSIGTRHAGSATLHDVDPKDIRESVAAMLSAPTTGPGGLGEIGAAARLAFERDNADFRRNFTPFLIHAPTPLRRSTPPLAKARIAILGNFRPEHSTENDLAWTFRDMGHTVQKFQEDEKATEDILKDFDADLFLWIHTHGWASPGKLDMCEVLGQLKARKIPTAAFHLDVYVGLNKLDGRQSRIGAHPWWDCDVVFTADGSPQSADLFKACGVNHKWLPPGIAKKNCYLGTRREELAVPIAFCGAEHYHDEWPWRKQMLDYLRSYYGDKFQVFNGFRGKGLNDLYASVDVLVGDCCFAGRPYYTSDRWPETCGRGGFLLAPQIEGVCIPLATFVPCDVTDMTQRIDYYLEHKKERELIREATYLHTIEHDTYHDRMTTLLRTINL